MAQTETLYLLTFGPNGAGYMKDPTDTNLIYAHTGGRAVFRITVEDRDGKPFVKSVESGGFNPDRFKGSHRETLVPRRKPPSDEPTGEAPKEGFIFGNYFFAEGEAVPEPLKEPSVVTHMVRTMWGLTDLS